MIEYINHNAVKMIIFFLLFSGGLFFIAINNNNPKRLLFFLIFYIPLSFKSASGTLSLYLIFFIYLLSFRTQIRTQSTDSQNSMVSIDTILIISILIATVFSIFNTGDLNFIYFDERKIRIEPDCLTIIIMFSNLALYFMVKKFIANKEDIIKIIKYMVISGSIASLAGYLQLISPDNTLLFKYIVISNNPAWATRIAATMQGYEMLAEYTAILIVLSFLLLFLSQKKLSRIAYSALILNFFIIMTLTQTRGIYIAVAISIVYLIFLFFITGKLKAGLKFSTGSVAIIVILIISIIFIDQLRPDRSFIERFERFGEVDVKQGKFASRTSAWEYGYQMIHQMSLSEKLLGAGNKYLGGEKKGIRTGGWPHCLYFSYVIRDGFIGMGLLLLLFAWLYKASLNGIFHEKSLHDKELTLIALCLHLAFIIFIIDEAKIEFIRSDRAQSIFWVIFGLIAACSSLVNKNLSKKSKLKGSLYFYFTIGSGILPLI